MPLYKLRFVNFIINEHDDDDCFHYYNMLLHETENAMIVGIVMMVILKKSVPFEHRGRHDGLHAISAVVILV